MGDMLFDDFDVDALLDAQSSDDDGSDLPDFERSLDDILNDTDFADIVGDSSPTHGRGAIRLDGEVIDSARYEVEYQNGDNLSVAVKTSLSTDLAKDGARDENTEIDISPIGLSIDENLQMITSTIDYTPALPSSNFSVSEYSSQVEQSLNSNEGSDTQVGIKRISSSGSAYGTWDSYGKASIAPPALVDYLPQFANGKSSPRPGAAFAAAAAASRQSGAPQLFVPRSLGRRLSPTRSSTTGTLDSGSDHLDEYCSFKVESSLPLPQILDETTGRQESLELDAAEEDTQDSGDMFANVGFMNFSSENSHSSGHTGVEWNSEITHSAVIAHLSEEAENVPTLSQPHEQPSSSSSSDSSILVGEDKDSLSVIEPDGYNTSKLEVGLSGSDIGVEVDKKPPGNFKDHPSELHAQDDPTEPELSEVASLNNLTEETQEYLVTSTEALSNFQMQKTEWLAARRDSVYGSVVPQQAMEDREQNQQIFTVEKVVDASTGVEEKPESTALHVAEELERKAASSGLHWEEGAVAQPMRLEGIQRGAPAIGLLQLDSGGSLSYALQSSSLRREHGVPQALAVQSNFIAVGLSKGGILVIPSKYSATRSADETDAKHFVLATPGPDKSVSSMCFNQQGDLLLVGYSNGHLMLWDVPKANVIKTLEKEHSVAVVHTLFLGQDVPGARNFKAITSDSKGLTLLHTFTVLPVPVLRRYTVNTTCILDGQRTGIVLSVSPLLPEEGSQSTGGSNTAPHAGSSVPMNLSSVMGVVGAASGADVGRKFLYDGALSCEESGGGGLVVFVTHQVALVVRLLPSVEVCARLSRPEGIREGAMPYTAWRRTKMKSGVPASNLGPNGSAMTLSAESVHAFTPKDAEARFLDNAQSQEDTTAEGVVMKGAIDGGENCPSLAIAWDRKVLIYKLPKSDLKSVAQWEMDSPAVGVAWLEEQMMVVATSSDQLCLFTNEGIEIERAVMGSERGGMGAFIYHTHFMNLYGNPEKAHHNALAVRGAALYLLGPNRLWRARLLPWRDRIKALENAGDWMGAFHIAMEIYDGRSQGVTGLPRGLEAMREAIMPTLLALLSAYIDEAFAYLSLALGPSTWPPMMKMAPEPTNKEDSLSQKRDLHASEIGTGVETSVQEMVVEAREQYARVGGVAIEFCVHIRKTEVLFENVFSKFEAVGQRGTFLELLEPYILKDMLGGLAPEVMQALVEHYSSRGWLNRVEQCVLHMDIASLDFNQVVRVCREHGLYSALIYLFTKGLDDFKSPLEELLAVAQNSRDLSQAQAFGYKLLVYLKYCFAGLAFPPGNGSLSSSRLPTLRAELLGYLLDSMETCREGIVTVESAIQKCYSRLLYLLKLDTKACLLVLEAAFPEDGPLGVGKRDWVHPGISIKTEQANITHDLDSQSRGHAVPTAENMVVGLKLAQETIDAVIHVLQTACVVERTSNSDDALVSSSEQWPTERDRGDMLEFVAKFAAWKYVVVPAAIMSHVLEHLTSPSFKDSAAFNLMGANVEILKMREDLMVALLRAVPKLEWDMEQTLQLAQKAGYWQVSALLHAQMNDYTAALDSYLKDASRPQHPFIFISHMFSSKSDLEVSSLSSFHEAVLSRLPVLIELSTHSTLFVVLQYFSTENQRILKELAPHPRLLFHYLKAVMNIRSSGLDYSQSGLEMEVGSAQLLTLSEMLRRSPEMAFCGDAGERNGDHSVRDSQVYLADLLQRSGLEFTNEMAETFVELLCQFEPKSVLRFLESYENYRLEHCLKLCQEYGITDAAAFLLERVGDVASALTLVLADVHVAMKEMDQVVAWLVTTPAFIQNLQSSMGDEYLNLVEVASAHSILQAAVALCQRNTFRLEPKESETLWFRLLDRFVEFLHKFNKHMKSSSIRKQQALESKTTPDTRQDGIQSKDSVLWKVWGSDLASKILRKVLVRFIGDIVNGMMGYVPLPIIMSKILEDHRGHEFGDFKAIILDMLSAYGYERAILGTAKQLIEDDTFQNISVLKRGSTHAFSPVNSTCAICDGRLDEPGLGLGAKNRLVRSTGTADNLKGKADEATSSPSSETNQIGFRVFPCGHATHLGCFEVDSGSETRRSSSKVVCPMCSCNGKPVNLSFHSKDLSLVKGGVIEVGAGKAKEQESIAYRRQSSMYRTTNHTFRQSRLQLLKHLEKGTELHELGLPLKLNLAPALTQYKRETLPYSGSTRVKSTGKPLSASSLRGDNWLTPQRKSKARAQY